MGTSGALQLERALTVRRCARKANVREEGGANARSTAQERRRRGDRRRRARGRSRRERARILAARRRGSWVGSASPFHARPKGARESAMEKRRKECARSLAVGHAPPSGQAPPTASVDTRARIGARGANGRDWRKRDQARSRAAHLLARPVASVLAFLTRRARARPRSALFRRQRAKEGRHVDTTPADACRQ
ncbi:hypothetical protein HPB50_022962 [Hyalomma asiaticum]|uniref:Uncharacterized protein n=1 Tax=Hyalomma asiaticum TaxID=266040 RepID=A0ACB7S8N6_HYAAI|nr:hypothetical protein HPB50_022962 [Hyalomma asiaticum]